MPPRYFNHQGTKARRNTKVFFVILGDLVTLWQEIQFSHQGTKARRNTKVFFVILGDLVTWWRQ
jgi:hypothetical protein